MPDPGPGEFRDDPLPSEDPEELEGSWEELDEEELEGSWEELET